MNTSITRHAFAIPALLLSIVITSTMALIPTLAGAGAHRAALDAQTQQTAASSSAQAPVAA